MKFLLLIGGVIGFAIGLTFSWLQENSLSSSVWHACLAAYLSAWLLFWWGKTWQKGFEQVMQEREAAQSGSGNSQTAHPTAKLTKA
jgi:O-antigen/teichoic acid export membrane protein